MTDDGAVLMARQLTRARPRAEAGHATAGAAGDAWHARASRQDWASAGPPVKARIQRARNCGASRRVLWR